MVTSNTSEERSGRAASESKNYKEGSYRPQRTNHDNNDPRSKEQQNGRTYGKPKNGESRDYKPRGNAEGREYRPRNSGENKEYRPRNNGEGKDYRPRSNGENKDYRPRNNGDGRDFKPRSSNTGNFRSNDNRNGDSRNFRSKDKDSSSAVKEQQPDKFDTIKRIEKEQKAVKKKKDNQKAKSANARPQIHVKRSNNIDWTKEYENDSFDDDDAFYNF